MMSLIHLTLAQARKGLMHKDFTCVELVQAYLDQMRKTKSLNAYITETPAKAMDMARASDQRLASGTAGILEGIPIAVKDAYCTQDVLTTAASKMLHNFVPSYESSVTQSLWNQGAVMVGKTNLDEFCMGSTTTPEYTGASYNPWNTKCTAGGSSGGSAVAVSCGSALAALGTDTGGSVRQPASFCGIVGVRPTYGRCSRWGVTAFSSSLDSPGPFARTVQDAALLLQAISGHDPKDATSLRASVPCFEEAIGRSVRGMRVGVPKEWYEQASLDPDIQSAWDKGQEVLRDAGCTIVPFSIPLSLYSLSCYYIISCAEASSNLQRYDGVKYGFRPENIDSFQDFYATVRGKGFGSEVKRRVLIGTYVLSSEYYDAYYRKAQRVRHQIQDEFQSAFHNVDVMLSPTTPTPAFPLERTDHDPVKMYWNDVLTVPVNISNTTAISVPAGLSKDRLPIGLQLIAPPLQEERLFQFGQILEDSFSMPPLPFDAGE
jgi:aspartyl-tRNA(Asn)/glutamyl-tRNA(Gln) amidotransferase subunit A